MSTRKLSDKEFDRYARNLLKKPEGVAFDKGAWAAMEQQLDQAGTSSSVFSLKWIIPTGVIIISTILYFLFQVPAAEQFTLAEGKSNTENLSLDSEKIQNLDQKIGDSIADQGNLNASILTSRVSTNSSASEESAYSKSLNKPDSKTEEFESENLSAANSSEKESNKLSQTTEEITVQAFSNDNSSEEKNTKASLESNAVLTTSGIETTQSDERGTISSSQQEAILQNEKGKMAETKKINDLEPKSDVILLPLIDYGEPKLTPLVNDEKEQNEVSSSSKEEVETLPFRRWSIGLTLAPDFSTVGQLNEFTQPGIDAGLSVEYFITKRLSVTSGAILTRKLYSTTDVSEYTIPTGFWNGAGAPEEITADCRVIDIPINIRYRLTAGDRTSFFASAGMSSYLMLNEQYDYSYAYGQGNGNQPTGWEVSNENNHFFGVYNLSAGVIRRVGRNLYIEAEPFLKNSLGGVGWGQVRLKSTGVLFHLKYKF